MTKSNIAGLRAVAFVFIAGLLGFTPAVFARADDLKSTHKFSIPAQSLDTALLAFSDQAKVQVLMRGGAKADAQSSGAVGELISLDALKSILQNTGFGYQQIDRETVAIVPTGSQSSGTSMNTNQELKPIRLSQSDSPVAQDSGQSSSSSSENPKNSHNQSTASLPSSEDKGHESKLEEVVVTGSNIKGGVVTGPLMTIDRQAIDTGGFSTIQQAIDNLPANFGGGINPQTTGRAGLYIDNSNLNAGGASSANLRGLGSNATLVLLDGHRLSDGAEGVSVDLSLIPLSIVDRIEILADGASSIYGSDAIAGVINIITRHDFDGFETRARAGWTDGAGPAYQIAQLAGFNWAGGNLELNYQHDDRDALSTAKRALTDTGSQPGYILPAEHQDSFYFNLIQSITSDLRAYLQGDFSQRNNEEVYNFGTDARPTLYDEPNSSNGGSLVGGVDYAAGGSWTVDAFGEYTRSRLSTLLEIPNTATVLSHYIFATDIAMGQIKASGDLLNFPGGPLKAAFGAEYRHEDAQSSSIGSRSDFPRNVYAAFAELDTPLISKQNSLPWLQRADLVLSGRFEHYSDSGDTFNPKVGIAVTPVSGFVLRGNYSTAFRAPQGFEETNIGPVSSYVHNASDSLSPTGVSTIIYRAGGNPGLTPEKANNFTIGGDYSPADINGLKFAVDYYNIKYKDRIVTPDPNFVGLANLAAPSIQGLITRNPPFAEVTALLAKPATYHNYLATPVNPASISAIVDGRYQNFADTKTSGMDFSALYSWQSDWGNWQVSANATYIFDFSTLLSPTSSYQSLVNTIYYPAAFKARGGLTWQLGSWSAATYANFVNSYTDNRVPTAPVPVSSWTTIDLHVEYALSDDIALNGHGKTSLSVDVSNLFDTQPPYAAPTVYGTSYDPTNSSVIGRFVSLQLLKRW